MLRFEVRNVGNNVNGFWFGFGVSWQMMKLSSFCGRLLVSLRLIYSMFVVFIFALVIKIR